MTAPTVIGVLAVFAVGMATTTAITVKWTAQATGPMSASVVQFVLAMMAAMFVGVLVYFAIGETPGVVAGLWVAAVLMSASVFLVFVGFLREMRLRERAVIPGTARLYRTAFLASVIGLVLANEFLMGWSFSLVAGTLPIGLGPQGERTPGILAGAVTSSWFVFPMALEMVLTLWFFRRRLPPELARFLVVQPAIMVCSPPTIPGLPWLVASTVGASALMAAAIAWLLIVLFRGEALPPRVAQYLFALFLSFGVMAGGLYVWAEVSNAGLFALALIVQMVIFLWAVTDLGHFGGTAAEDRGPSVPAPTGAEVERS